MSPRANWSYPTAIRFGAGRISELAEACRRGGHQEAAAGHRPRTGIAADHHARSILLEAAGLGRAMFAEVDPNPNEI
jgi:alcohol dehydrogenase